MRGKVQFTRKQFCAAHQSAEKNNVIVFLHELKIKKVVADGRMHNEDV